MRHLKKQTLDGNVETLLLAILQSGPSYGYAIIKELNNCAGGLLQMGEGTIYPVLHRLEKKGLITSYWSDAENGRQRKYYRLSPKGKKALSANYVQWQMMSNIIEKVLASSGKLAPIPLWKG
jgi:DNA-binding PadR family transcriptional regulator